MIVEEVGRGVMVEESRSVMTDEGHSDSQRPHVLTFVTSCPSRTYKSAACCRVGQSDDMSHPGKPCRTTL